MSSTIMPKTHLSSQMKKDYVREQQIEKYLNYLFAFYKVCGNAYAEYSHTQAAKKYNVTNNILVSLRKTGLVKCLDAQGKKLYKWNLAIKPTEDHAERLWEDVKSTSRLYTLNKRAKQFVPKNKNGKPLVPIAGSRKEIKNEEPVVEPILIEQSIKKGRVSATKMLEFLNDVYINCKLGDVKSLKVYADKYHLHAAYTVVLKQNGYVSKNDKTRLLEWTVGEPNIAMAEKFIEDVSEYNTRYYYNKQKGNKSIESNNNTVKTDNTTQVKENPPSNEPIKHKNEQLPQTGNSIKDRLITKLINAGKLQEAEILLDQMLQGK